MSRIDIICMAAIAFPIIWWSLGILALSLREAEPPSGAPIAAAYLDTVAASGGPITLVIELHNRMANRARVKGGASALTKAMDAVAAATKERSRCMKALGRADSALARAQAWLAQERHKVLRQAERASDSDTHPTGGDAVAAPFMGSAGPKDIAQTSEVNND